MLNLANKLLIGFAIASFSVVSIVQAGEMSADEILKKVEVNTRASNEVAQLKMLIKGRDGSEKERELTIKKQNQSTKKALVKLQAPEDLRGVGFLSIDEKGAEENQWLFLPSERRSRRITSSGKGGNFLDSDLSYEDLSTSTYKNFENKVEKVYEKSGKKVAIILSKVKDKSASSYSKIKTWIDVKNYRIMKVSYYNKRGKLSKKVQFSNYKKYGKVWRAQKLKVKNLRTRSQTILTVKNISFENLNEGDFTISSLESM